jgi:hypothetical protein
MIGYFIIVALVGWAAGCFCAYLILRMRTHGSYQGRVVALGRVADKIPSMEGGTANMTAYTVSMTNKYDGDLALRIFKRDNPLWSMFEGTGPSDEWIVRLERVKAKRRKITSLAKIHEGVFYNQNEGPWG